MATYLGISEGHFDPAVAIVRDGVLLAFVEEERLLRYKHAPGLYPVRALKWALDEAGVKLDEIDAVAVPWDIDAFGDGRIADFYAGLAARHDQGEATRRWQATKLRDFSADATEGRHHQVWRRYFGISAPPPIRGVAHHYAHVVQAGLQSPYEESIVLTIDGSGDTECTVIWLRRGSELEQLHQITMPDSLGWFYAAITEFLGFHAYGEEYKVMGLAAYGTARPDLNERVSRMLSRTDGRPEYRLDPAYIHNGRHSTSGRFTDQLTELFGRDPRQPDAPMTQWHMDLAYTAQRSLEDTVCRLVGWAIEKTGVINVSLGGGVAHNVKLSLALSDRTRAERVFAHPLCGDSGAAAGAALALSRADGYDPEPLTTVALGPHWSDEEVERELGRFGCRYRIPADLPGEVAGALADGAVVGWAQGRLEAGHRALGQRSILADPRRVEARDRVNSAIKMRENWRPFCPAMPAGDAHRYLVGDSDYRFMTATCRATDALSRLAPAVVHVDGTVRPQVVDRELQGLFHELLTRFGERTGVPVLLNTSFNLAGEPIVSSVADAVRTFWSSGLDLLVVGRCVVDKRDMAG
ncbi:carbamoyltransferase [Nonomuraea sp. NPDC050451]|uniref:carbamoyltransferase n=1 Tax=Nonomuraea sp. NPDC050451 TaxID=3364364 RepID=UPI0037A55AEC